MVQFRTFVCVLALGVVLGGAPGTAWPENEGVPAGSPAEVAKASFLAYYTGEYGALYELTSLRDRQVKTKAEYLSERPPFEDAERAVAKLLAKVIRFERSEVKIQGDRARVTLIGKIPDDSKPPLADILEEPGQRIGELKRALESGELPFREERFTLVLVRESEAWRVFFGWASAVKVRFSGEVKMNLPWEFGPKRSSVRVNPGETLQIAYYVRNLASKEVTGKARHFITPKESAKYVEIVQCFCFIQQTLDPGERMEMPLTFRIRWDAPEDLKEIRVHYAFYPLRFFEEEWRLQQRSGESR